MYTITSEAEMKKFESQRALISVYLDRMYSDEKIEWLLNAKEAFDEHARSSWHILIPAKSGYGVDSFITAGDFNLKLSAQVIDRIGIKAQELPCLLFRINDDDCFYLSLNGKNKNDFLEEISQIADVSRECYESEATDERYREYVNSHVAAHLNRKSLLKAARGAMPRIAAFISFLSDAKNLK